MIGGTLSWVVPSLFPLLSSRGLPLSLSVCFSLRLTLVAEKVFGSSERGKGIWRSQETSLTRVLFPFLCVFKLHSSVIRPQIHSGCASNWPLYFDSPSCMQQFPGKTTHLHTCSSSTPYYEETYMLCLVCGLYLVKGLPQEVKTRKSSGCGLLLIRGSGFLCWRWTCIP